MRCSWPLWNWRFPGDEVWESSFGDEECFIVSSARKQRVEVNWEELNEADKEKFRAAKQKEVNAWMDHKTVKRVAGVTLDPSQIMKRRWILVWKPPEKEGGERRAKARLVILGFQDPGISYVPNDAPTPRKDGKSLLLQMVSSQRWTLLNFDISTAFLKGEGDGRKLGIHPTQEISEALKMKGSEQCQVVGGAYGRIDAPYLWYQAFRTTLEDNGFVVCPFDSCLFFWLQQTSSSWNVRNTCRRWLGGRRQCVYGSLRKSEMEIQFWCLQWERVCFLRCEIFPIRRWDHRDWSEGLYINRIEPITISRESRQTPLAAVTDAERQELRRVCGSLQYAVVNTRPDVAGKVGECQSSVVSGTVGDLLQANRVLMETKGNPLCLSFVPIPVKAVTFCGFSDASFATSRENTSRQGTIIFTTNSELLDNKVSVICPVAWSSRKVPQVVRSTLSAESVALSSTLDRISWLRLLWEWLKDPSVDLTDPSEILGRAPLAGVATDCKSVFDVTTKTATSTCEEFRTTLELLLIRERLKEKPFEMGILKGNAGWHFDKDHGQCSSSKVSHWRKICSIWRRFCSKRTSQETRTARVDQERQSVMLEWTKDLKLLILDECEFPLCRMTEWPWRERPRTISLAVPSSSASLGGRERLETLDIRKRARHLGSQTVGISLGTSPKEYIHNIWSSFCVALNHHVWLTSFDHTSTTPTAPSTKWSISIALVWTAENARCKQPLQQNVPSFGSFIFALNDDDLNFSTKPIASFVASGHKQGKVGHVRRARACFIPKRLSSSWRRQRHSAGVVIQRCQQWHGRQQHHHPYVEEFQRRKNQSSRSTLGKSLHFLSKQRLLK